MPSSKSAPARFTKDFFDFFRELEENNNREWFAENKARYERSVLEPSVRFVADAGKRLRSVSRHVAADAKPYGGSISRIYRDIRFAKDKSPYKTYVTIHLHHAKGTEATHGGPGFYLFLEPGESFVASGIWHPEAPTRKRIRDAIVARPAAWKAVQRSRPNWEGELANRVPPGYDPDHAFAEDLRRKDYVATKAFKESQVVGPRFMHAFVRACRGMSPVNRFLAQAVGLPW